MSVLRVVYSLFFCSCIIFFLTTGGVAHALDEETPTETNTPVNSLDAYLIQEKEHLIKSTDDAKARLLKTDLSVAEITALTLQNSRLLSLLQDKIANLNDFLGQQHKRQQQLNRRLKKLQHMPLDKLQNNVLSDQRIMHTQLLSVQNNQTITLLEDNLTRAQNYQSILLDERNRLNLLQANMVEQQQFHKLHEAQRTLNEARELLYQKNKTLQQQQLQDMNFADNLDHETRILLNNQAIILIQYQITELDLEKKRISANYLLLKKQDFKTIESVVERYHTSMLQLADIQQSLIAMIDRLRHQSSLVSNTRLKKDIVMMTKTAQKHLNHVIAQQVALKKELQDKQAQFNKPFASRHSLTEYHLDSWPMITQQLIQLPTSFYAYTRLLVLKVWDHYLRQGIWSWVMMWTSLTLILFAALAFGRLLHRVVQGKERSNMAGHLYDGALILLYRNLAHLTLATMLMVILFLNQVMFANYELLLNLFLVWLTFRNLILIARLVLLERISDASGQDVTLYYRLQWLLLAGGWSTALMIFSHQLPLSLLLQDIFNRLFMLFLLALSLVAWKSKDVIPYLLRPVLRAKKRYLHKALSLLVVLVPLTLLTTAIIGLIGYIDLAWTMSRYQAYLLIMITSYVLVRGLILDAIDFASQWMITHLENGWLWVEVILKPLDGLARVSIFCLALLVLFQLFGWSTDSHVVSLLRDIGQYPFVNSSGVHITLFSAFSFIAVLFVFLWFAKWTREFAYRWLYRGINDPGIRNSVSILTQYLVVLCGGLITLRVLGIDFTGMAIVFGGLAVGMGFGLRDFASNIVGGVILLIERPVREGDLITLGEYEGRVAHIGIRSMRVSSWDNMEVLIPNAETFNKPFTNWTLQDNIVRTVVPIKVNRADDPLMIQQLIHDVLVIIPEVLETPPPQVLLKQIDDVLIDFEVRYFINVQSHTRFEVRSKVLFAIMAQFKAAGVRAPTPSLQIELNDLDRDDAVSS
jgi:potassium efflux system protein